VYFPLVTLVKLKDITKIKSVLESQLKQYRATVDYAQQDPLTADQGFVSIRTKPPITNPKLLKLPCDVVLTVCAPASSTLQHDQLLQVEAAFSSIASEYFTAYLFIPTNISMHKQLTVRSTRDDFVANNRLYGIKWLAENGYSLTYSLTQYLFAYSLTYSLTHSLTHSPTHSLTHSPTHSLTLTHSLTHPLTHSLLLTHSLTYSPTHLGVGEKGVIKIFAKTSTILDKVCDMMTGKGATLLESVGRNQTANKQLQVKVLQDINARGPGSATSGETHSLTHSLSTHSTHSLT
jgi:hypothetical protein